MKYLTIIPRLSVALTLVFTGCTYGHRAYTETIPLSHPKIVGERSTQSVNDIQLFFGTSLPKNREYVQTHFLQVEGGYAENYTAVLNELKAKAYIYNADGIIQVDRAFKTRKKEVLFSDDPAQEYTSTVLSGVCIKYMDDPLLPVMLDSVP